LKQSFRILGALVCLALAAIPALAQAPMVRTVMVVPFVNQSGAPGLEWIGEAFPEVLSQRMTSPRVSMISREDRTYAFDHTGIPLTVQPSRATIYEVAEQMDADYVVMGNYKFDGKTFSASAQLLDMKKLHLFPAVESSGSLTNLIDLQTSLAWELLQQMGATPGTTREQFLKASPPIRLDAFENYIRGVVAVDGQQKIHYFRQAVKLDPNYTMAVLQLGQVYFETREYEAAASWFAKISRADASGGEASFFLGMSEFYLGNFDKAYAAFNYLATRLPLTEVYNNLGVVDARRGHFPAAVEYFSKAVEADPNDSDYRFNLAVALYRKGDSAAASRQLKEVLQRRPSDGEAKALLDQISRGVPPPAPVTPGTHVPAGSATAAAQTHVPMERIKRNYDESSYRQLAMEIRNVEEARLASTDRHTHAAYHMQHGRELLAENMVEQAVNEFRDAVSVDPGSAAAHAGLAVALEKKGDTEGARKEAEASVQLQANVEALLVLARLNLKQDQVAAASGNVDRALAIEPANSGALALKRDIAARPAVSTAPH
jgi:Tfp pilus assembly protein PilF